MTIRHFRFHYTITAARRLFEFAILLRHMWYFLFKKSRSIKKSEVITQLWIDKDSTAYSVPDKYQHNFKRPAPKT